MDPQEKSHDITPHRLQSGRPTRQFSDFAPSRPQTPGAPGGPRKPIPVLDLRANAPQPASPQLVRHRPIQATPQPATPTQERIEQRPATPTPLVQRPVSHESVETPTGNVVPPKKRGRTGYAWVVGWGLFIVLTALALAPFLSGKILDNFPGSSYNTSSGDQALACINAPTSQKTVTTYDHKNGFPLVYSYATTSKITASCDNQTRTADGGHASQFNPLAGIADIAITVIIALVVARVWRLIFGTEK